MTYKITSPVILVRVAYPISKYVPVQNNRILLGKINFFNDNYDDNVDLYQCYSIPIKHVLVSAFVSQGVICHEIFHLNFSDSLHMWTSVCYRTGKNIQILFPEA